MPAARPLRFLLLLGVLASIAVPAAAGTICGTVRDGLTQQPVAQAGIFVRATSGASDGTGHFCIDAVPAGTYDLEVRVDDYQVGWVRGVVVTSGTTGVDVPARTPRSTLAPPSPNPARSSVRLAFRVPSADRVSLEVLDAQGRVLRAWSGAGSPDADRSVVWDLRDRSGRAVPAGRYFIRLRHGDAALVRSVVRLP